MSTLWDDPSRDFRQRYRVPEHFLWDSYDLKSIDYEGYLEVAFSLLPRPPLSILDVGCGDGWVAAKAIERGYDITGIDYSDRAIKFAELLVPGAKFEEGDIRALEKHAEWTGVFDAALHVEVLEHIPPQYYADVLKGINACVKPGGTFVLTVPSVYMPVNRWHYKHFSREEITQLLVASGFKVETIVNQFRLSFLTSYRFWKLLSNRFYDLRVARVLFRRLLLDHHNITDDPAKAGRYIIRARKS